MQTKTPSYMMYLRGVSINVTQAKPDPSTGPRPKGPQNQARWTCTQRYARTNTSIPTFPVRQPERIEMRTRTNNPNSDSHTHTHKGLPHTTTKPPKTLHKYSFPPPLLRDAMRIAPSNPPSNPPSLPPSVHPSRQLPPLTKKKQRRRSPAPQLSADTPRPRSHARLWSSRCASARSRSRGALA